MIVLGIESTCDETASAIVELRNSDLNLPKNTDLLNLTNSQKEKIKKIIVAPKLLSNIVHSQINIHAQFGGVIPEIAARSHIEYINPVINKALHDAGLNFKDIDAVAVSYAPGLNGSLLIGTLAARTYAYTFNKPLYPVHHVEAHIYASFLSTKITSFPFLSLVVSGGHSQIVLFKGHSDYQILGETQDDAVGEAFDKVAKIIGLPYPGGPAISECAKKGDENKYKLPKAKLSNKYDFSFSGLKTAVLRAIQKEVNVDFNFPSFKLAEKMTDQQKYDFAASFQKVACETLVDKLVKASKEYNINNIVIAGGVAANERLREEVNKQLPSQNIHIVESQFCTDNAAMIATLGAYHAILGIPSSPLDLEVKPSLSMKQSTWL